jgi:hypothetical protein
MATELVKTILASTRREHLGHVERLAVERVEQLAITYGRCC